MTEPPPPSLMNKTMTYRLDIDPEFQGWILIFATVTVVFLFLLPCHLAGSSFTICRRTAAWLMLRLPLFYALMSGFNLVFIFLVLKWLPDWNMKLYIKACVGFAKYAAVHLLKSMESIVIIVAAMFVFAFKDRIALILGLDHKTLFRCKTRDCLTCFSSSRFQAVELEIFKLEDLVAGDIFSANNVFVEVHMGYNEEMKTRVRNNAGAACIMKETIQMNWDPEDDEDQLLLLVKNQKMVGAAELGRLHLDPEALKDLFNESKSKLPPGGMNDRWKESQFVRADLNPRGAIWYRLMTVDEEKGSLAQDLTTC